MAIGQPVLVSARSMTDWSRSRVNALYDS